MTEFDAERKEDREQLNHEARRVARRQAASAALTDAPSLLGRLPVLRQGLRQVHKRFVQSSDEQGILSGVAEWILDNFYVVEKALRQIEENMPPGYYSRLPKLEATQLRGHPRVYALAREIIRASAGKLDLDYL